MKNRCTSLAQGSKQSIAQERWEILRNKTTEYSGTPEMKGMGRLLTKEKAKRWAEIKSRAQQKLKPRVS